MKPAARRWSTVGVGWRSPPEPPPDCHRSAFIDAGADSGVRLAGHHHAGTVGDQIVTQPERDIECVCVLGIPRRRLGTSRVARPCLRSDEDRPCDRRSRVRVPPSCPASITITNPASDFPGPAVNFGAYVVVDGVGAVAVVVLVGVDREDRAAPEGTCVAACVRVARVPSSRAVEMMTTEDTMRAAPSALPTTVIRRRRRELPVSIPRIRSDRRPRSVARTCRRSG